MCSVCGSFPAAGLQPRGAPRRHRPSLLTAKANDRGTDRKTLAQILMEKDFSPKSSKQSGFNEWDKHGIPEDRTSPVPLLHHANHTKLHTKVGRSANRTHLPAGLADNGSWECMGAPACTSGGELATLLQARCHFSTSFLLQEVGCNYFT